MKSKSGKVLITVSIAIVAAVFASIFSAIPEIGTVYAWFIHDVSKATNSNMGVVKVEITDAAEVSEDGSVTFEIANSSTIDTYLRLGWTPVYKDKITGKELTRDVSQIEIEAAALSGISADGSDLDGMGMTPSLSMVTSHNGYEKRMITIEDGNGKYFVVPAGESVRCRITLKGLGDHQSDSDLYIITVPEALQATRKAVKEAAPYGWDENKADKQAGTVVLREVRSNEQG